MKSFDMPLWFNRVLIVGVGLIGSSIGMNLMRQKLAREVIGVGRHEANLKEAVRRRAIHRCVLAGRLRDLLNSLVEEDLVILAVPVRDILNYLDRLSAGKGRPLVIDVGSAKTSIIRRAVQNRIRFIGCHPIAGTEKSGAAAGEVGLFEKRLCLVTPLRSTALEDLKKIRLLWNRLGSRVELMEAGRHDRLLAALSHLPHAAAYSLMGAVAGLVSPSDAVKFAFGGLKDTTRIAASSPEMWKDILIENSGFVLPVLKRYQGELRKLQSSITGKDSKGLLRYLKKAREVRLKIS